MKKRSIKTIIIILLVLTITITAPVGSYINSITQSNQIAYASPGIEAAIQLIKYVILPALGLSAMSQSRFAVSEFGEYVEDKVQQFMEQPFKTAEMTQMLMKYPSLLFALQADRVDLLTEEEIDPYIEENLAYQSEYMGLTLEEKRIAMMEARMNMADGNLSVSELYKYQGIRDIAAAFINFFTNQLILDGYLTEEAELGEPTLYQEWENFPDTPFKTDLKPYQYIGYRYNDSSIYLFGSNSKFYCITTSYPWRRMYTSPSVNVVYYKLIDGIWVLQSPSGWDGETPTTAGLSDYNVPATNNIIQSNNNIYNESDLTTIYFGKTILDEPEPSLTIDDFLEDTTKVPLYPITANPTYDPASEDPTERQPGIQALQYQSAP